VSGFAVTQAGLQALNFRLVMATVGQLQTFCWVVLPIRFLAQKHILDLNDQLYKKIAKYVAHLLAHNLPKKT